MAVLRVLGLRQHLDFAAQEHVARVIHDHVPAGVVGARRAVDALDVAGLVEGEDVIDLQRADDVVLAVGEARWTSLKRSCLPRGDYRMLSLSICLTKP